MAEDTKPKTLEEKLAEATTLDELKPIIAQLLPLLKKPAKK